jgi:membrane fusion protein, multidrug efflux system
MKCQRLAILSPVVIYLFTVLLLGCTSNKVQFQENSTVKVKTETVTGSNVMNNLNYIGVVEDESTISLSFSAIGTIEKIFVSEGERVRKGQLIAKLNTTSAQNMYDAAESALKQAQDGFIRLKSIHDNGSLPEIQMVEIETKLQQAKASCNIAKKNLDDCVLYAPVNGIIGKKMAEAGENTIPGKSIVTIIDINTVKVKFSVPEKEINLIPANCISTITVSALGDKAFTGKGVEKNVSANVVSHSYPVHIKLANPEKNLLPGMVCQVNMNLNDKSMSISIPINIVQTKVDGSKFIWLAKDNIAKRTIITTGEAKGNDVEITSGLSAGDRIVTEGYQKISEGDKLTEK